MDKTKEIEALKEHIKQGRGTRKARLSNRVL